jgi:hypothetical protein
MKAVKKFQSKSILLPQSEQEFELLLENLCKSTGIEHDDDSRQLLAGWIHSLPRSQDRESIAALQAVFRKAKTMVVTWGIVQAIQKKANQAKEPAEVDPQEETMKESLDVQTETPSAEATLQ